MSRRVNVTVSALIGIAREDMAKPNKSQAPAWIDGQRGVSVTPFGTADLPSALGKRVPSAWHLSSMGCRVGGTTTRLLND
jgi:hypothetical protein